MYKTVFFHSLVAGILASIAGLIYYRIYYFATQVDFSIILNTGKIIALNLLVSMVAGVLYWGLVKWLKTKGELVFNFLFSILSFAAVIIPISISLPLKVQLPELFPGLGVPMVFFPAIAWYTVKPLFPQHHIN